MSKRLPGRISQFLSAHTYLLTIAEKLVDHFLVQRKAQCCCGRRNNALAYFIVIPGCIRQGVSRTMWRASEDEECAIWGTFDGEQGNTFRLLHYPRFFIQFPNTRLLPCLALIDKATGKIEGSHLRLDLAPYRQKTGIYGHQQNSDGQGIQIRRIAAIRTGSGPCLICNKRRTTEGTV